MQNTNNVRYTATLPEPYLEELKMLAASKAIPSVNYGIKVAIDEYLKQQKKQQYEALMKKAAKDKAFVERTSSCIEDFKFSDSEVSGEW